MSELLEQFKNYFGTLSCCLDKEEMEKAKEAVECFYFEPSESGDGDIGAAVVKNVDGYFTYETWEDYTGHGCQCGTTVEGPFASKDLAIRMGLTEAARAVLGIVLND